MPLDPGRKPVDTPRTLEGVSGVDPIAGGRRRARRIGRQQIELDESIGGRRA
jgi:hypothetical protein